jgi:hypothetical protein
MSAIREAALAYAEAGWPVIPLYSPNGKACDCRQGDACRYPGKHPRPIHGLTEASTKLSIVDAWWRQWPEANVGIVVPKGFVVLDLDGAEGIEAIRAARLPMPPTATARTGREDGWHYVYRTSVPISPKVGILPHVDVRGPGSYIVAAPSRHVSGRQYRWERPLEAAVEAPGWIAKRTEARRREALTDGPIPEGERDETLTRIAGILRRPGVSEAGLLAALRVENKRCQPEPLPDEDLKKIAHSIARKAPQPKPSVRTEPVATDKSEVAGGLALADYLAAVETFMVRYVAFPSEHEPVAIALWVAHAHLVEQFDTSPILAITSAEMRSGKTRVLDCLELLVPHPERSITPSEAVLYTVLAERPRPTLLLDEVDAIFSPRLSERNEGIRAILNSGNRKGTPVPRVKLEGRRREVERFDVYGPKAIAGIGNLPTTVADRSIPIRMKRRAPTEPIARFRDRQARAEAAAIRLSVPASLVPDVPVPEALNDRAADSWEPLLVIADTVGHGWPERARAASLSLSCEVVEGSSGIRLLGDIREAFDQRAVDHLGTAELLDYLHQLDEAPWGDWYGKPLSARALARLLDPYRVRPVQKRLAGEKLRGYFRCEFSDTWMRYLPAPESGTNGTNGTNGTDVLQQVLDLTGGELLPEATA